MRSLLWLFFIMPSLLLAAQPDTCRLGLYVQDVYNFDLVRRSFNADFWLWVNHTNDSLHPLETIELVNAKDMHASLTSSKRVPNGVYSQQKINTTIKKFWNLRYFPFDVQEFRFEVESAHHDASQLVYVVDTAASGCNPDIQLEEWQVVDFRIEAHQATYATNYGDPTLSANTSYPRVTCSVWLKRRGESIFLKTFMGLYIAFAISLLIFALPYDSGDRFGILVGALFAAVGNKHIVDFFIPNTNTYTMVDKIHHFCFFQLLLFFLSSILIVGAARNQRLQRAKIINRLVLVIGVLSFSIFNIVLVWNALS